MFDNGLPVGEAVGKASGYADHPAKILVHGNCCSFNAYALLIGFIRIIVRMALKLVVHSCVFGFINRGSTAALGRGTASVLGSLAVEVVTSDE